MIPDNPLSRRQKLAPILMAVVMLLCGCSDKSTKMYRVGILSGSDAFVEVLSGFQNKMTELGYVEGENITYYVRRLNADPEGEKRAAEEFVADNVDLIFTVPTEPSVAAQEATKNTNIPVVFAYAGIEGSNLVDSVTQPGGHITGVRFPGPEQIGKRLEILIEFAPQTKRVWIGYDKNYPNTIPALKVLRLLASAKGIKLVEVPATSLEDLEADLAARAKSADTGVDAIILMPDTFNHCPDGWGLISKFASDQKVPIAGSFLYTVEQGSIFGNANDLVVVGGLAAPLADKILRGVAAGTIPVVTPEQDLWINYRAAQELGLTVPEGLLQKAEKIIR